MPIKDIKQYFELAERGDETLKERKEMILRQKQSVIEQIAALQENLKELEYKEIYYDTAIEAGTESIHSGKSCSPYINDEIDLKQT